MTPKEMAAVENERMLFNLDPNQAIRGRGYKSKIDLRALVFDVLRTREAWTVNDLAKRVSLKYEAAHQILKELKLLNSQNAEWLDVETTLIKQESMLVKGQKIMTNHYVLKGTKEGNERLVIELWYDEMMNWVGLKSPTPIGDIFYKLI